MKMRWMILAGMIAAAALATAAGDTAEAPYGGNILRSGNRDSDFPAEYVSLLQTDLEKLGYGDYIASYGPTRGIFAQGTTAAVKAFQADWGLAATGEVDAATAAAIAAARAGNPPPIKAGLPILTLVQEDKLTAKAGKGVALVEIRPAKGKSYIIVAAGKAAAIAVINPYGAYAPVKQPAADVKFALLAGGDEAEIAVAFEEAAHAGKYEAEITALNDLQDTPLTIRVYELTREAHETAP